MSIDRNLLALGPEIGTSSEGSSQSDTATQQEAPENHGDDRSRAGLSSVAPRQPPHLEHTYSAPATKVWGADNTGKGNRKTTYPKGSDDESHTPILAGTNSAQAAHGAGTKASPGYEKGYNMNGNDYQAGTIGGGETGPAVAAAAAAELGLNKEEAGDLGANHKEGLGRQEHSAHSNTRKVDRTASGATYAHQHATANGETTVPGVNMMPIHRQLSQPPAAGPFGGVAPEGLDAERGLRAMRSREEEEEREIETEKNGPDPWAVSFEPGEKANPKNWGVGYRWFLTGIAGLLVLNSTFASSAPSGIITDMILYFGFSQEVAILTISLFVAGYCVGPIIWGPLSESYGRRPIFICTFIVYTCFQVGCALSKNTASILVFRFLSGTFAAAPLTNSGAMLADIWDGDHRGQAMSLFSLAPFAGPSIGPIVSGFIEVSGTNWRWVYWILTMFAGFCLAVIVFLVPETYAPKILAQKAKRLRKDTQEERWYAPLERQKKGMKSKLNDIVCKPFIILALEPMLQAVTLYMSFVYGIVYLLFEAYPYVFEENHGFNAGEEGLAFLGFFLGGLSAVILFVVVIEPRYQRHAKSRAPLPAIPERRLELCVISAISLVVALFWFGWTSFASIHWISPVLAGFLIGVAALGMFVSLFNYIIDVYLWSAASALAAATVVRSLFGAAFPLFATQMYDRLGTQWATSLLGFLAILMAPIPIVLMKYGHLLRDKSKFSPAKA